MRVTLLLACAAALACNREPGQPTIGELPGDYKCNLGSITHKLHLGRDGHFSEEVSRDGTVTGSYTGDWESDKLTNSGRFVVTHLAGYHFDWPHGEDTAPGRIGDWFPIVQRINHQLALVVAADTTYYCVKQTVPAE